jgi:hypothetical protein
MLKDRFKAHFCVTRDIESQCNERGTPEQVADTVSLTLESSLPFGR